jgi:uncharacterized membrane protein
MNQRALFFLVWAGMATYGLDVKPILDSHCVECHSAGNFLVLSRFPFFSEATGDQGAIVDKILAKVGSNPPQMPPGNRPKLTGDEVSVIQQWREQGLAP